MFTTQQNKILWNNEPIRLRGASVPYSGWSNPALGKYASKQNYIEKFKQDFPDANCVRIPVLPGDDRYPDEGWFKHDWEKNYLIENVQKAIAQGLFPIIDLHYEIKWDKPNTSKHYSIEDLKDFWQWCSYKFRNYPEVIFEIFNEPTEPVGNLKGDWSKESGLAWNKFKDEIAQPIVDLVRSESDNLVLVGSPNWSTEGMHAVNYPVESKNIAYVIHQYNRNYGNFEKHYDQLIKTYPVVVTEMGFGKNPNTGEDREGGSKLEYGQDFTNELDQYELSYCLWSYADDQSPALIKSPGNLTEAGIFFRDWMNTHKDAPVEPPEVPADCSQYIARIKELEEMLENEKQRADELSDKLDSELEENVDLHKSLRQVEAKHYALKDDFEKLIGALNTIRQAFNEIVSISE